MDHAAATSLWPEVKALIKDLVDQDLANPSSLHASGRKARALIDQARQTCANIFQVDPEQVIFTSGATEAANLALHDKKSWVSDLAHSCLHEAARIKIENPEDAEVLALEHGCSETGHVRVLNSVNKKSDQKIVLDIAASLVTEDINLKNSDADALILSGEKFGGLSGAGLLIRDKFFEIIPLQGGTQEFGLRGGTENVIGIVALAKALSLHTAQKSALRKHFEDLHAYARAELKKAGLKIITPEKNYLPHILNFMLPKSDAHTFIVQSDIQRIELSAGTACSSGTTKPSKVLKSLGFSDEEALRGVRMSFGRNTIQEDLEEALKKIKALLSSGK